MQFVQYGPGAVHEWIEFEDPDNEGEFFRVNLSLMLSNYNCTFGAGCCSIKGKDIPNDWIGCCAQGVGFESDEDFEHVKEQVALLTEADCANLDHVRTKGWYVSNKHGPYKTRKKGPACIFANPTPTEPGDPPAGCSFHVLASRLGINHTETKPGVCWKVPIYVDDQEYKGYPITVVTAQTLEEWGGTPPDDYNDPNEALATTYLSYWCMDSPDAFNGKQVFYKYSEVELRKIMGDGAYEKLCELIDRYGDRKFKMPGELVNDGKPVIADLVSLYTSLREKRANRDAASGGPTFGSPATADSHDG